MNKCKLSVGILARFSEVPTITKELIPRLSWCDDIIVVVDSLKDINIKNSFPKGVRFYSKILENDYASQRNFLLDKARNNWVFFIDPDERFSQKFIGEVFRKIDRNSYRGLLIRREEVFLNKRLKHGEGVVWILRIGNKKYGKWEGNVHEEWIIKPEFLGKIKNRMTHFGYGGGIRGFLEKNLIYASIRAKELALYRKPNLGLIIFKPIVKFGQNYIWRGGFLDGNTGLIHALCMAFYSFATEMIIYEEYIKQKND